MRSPLSPSQALSKPYSVKFDSKSFDATDVPPSNNAPSSSSSSFRAIELWTLSFVCLAIFTDIVFFGVILPIQRQILTHFGLPPLPLFEAIVFSSYSFGYLIFTPLFGWLTLGKGRRAPMLVGLTFMIMAELLFAFPIIKGGSIIDEGGGIGHGEWGIDANGKSKYVLWPLAQLIIARILQGGAAGSNWTIGFSMLSDVYEQRRLGWAIGCVFIFHALGYFTGPILGGFFYQYIGYKWPFIMCASLTAIDFIIRFFLVSKKSQIDNNNDNNNNNNRRMNDTTNTTTGNNNNNEDVIKKENINGIPSPLLFSASLPRDIVIINNNDGNNNGNNITNNNGDGDNNGDLGIFPIILRNRTNIGVLVTAIFLGACSLAIVENLMPDHLQSLFKLSASQTSLGLLTFIIPNALTCLTIGWTVSPYYRRKVIAMGLILHPLFIIWPSYVTSFPLFIVLAICYGSTCAMIVNPCIPELGHIANQKGIDYGIVYAIFNLTYSIGMIVGPFGVVLLRRSMPFYLAMMPFGVACIIYSGIFYCIYDRNR